MIEDVSEGTDINKTSENSVIFVTIGVFYKKDLSFNWMSAKGVMIC